jgi:hypothetical protein
MHGGGKLPHLVGARDVHSARQHAAPELTDLFLRGGKARFVDIADDEIRFSSGKSQCRREPDTTGSSRNEDSFSLERIQIQFRSSVGRVPARLPFSRPASDKPETCDIRVDQTSFDRSEKDRTNHPEEPVPYRAGFYIRISPH